MNNESQNKGKQFYLRPVPVKKEAYCGHSVDLATPPSTNCKQCWTFYFIQNPDMTQGLGRAYLQPGGPEQITIRYGKKFVRKLEWFFDAIAKAKELSDIINKQMEDEALQDLEYDIVFPAPTSGQTVVEGVVV